MAGAGDCPILVGMNLSSVRVLFLLVPGLLGSGCGHRLAAEHPTFRLLRKEGVCEPCDIEVLARDLAGALAVDCGWAHEAAGRGVAVACARDAEATARPFRVGFDLNGIDSTIRTAFVRAPDGTLSRLWYDSDVSGGGATCAAMVSRQRCMSLRTDPSDPSLLDCELVGERSRICDEEFSSGRTWSPPADAGSLFCKEYWSNRLLCKLREGRVGNVPAGTALRCNALPTGALVCVKDEGSERSGGAPRP
jgi:hypothetical protein